MPVHPVKDRLDRHNSTGPGAVLAMSLLNPRTKEFPVSGSEILLIAVVILVPLLIAIAVTLWTLQPAVLRNERARRAQSRAARRTPAPTGEHQPDEPTPGPG